MRIAIDDAGKRDVLLDLFDFDGRFVTGLGTRYDDDVPAFDFRNSVTLVANRFDRHVAHLALVDQADPASENILLPSLDDGITLLDIDGSRGVPILQSPVLDHLLLHEGPTFWVDANPRDDESSPHTPSLIMAPAVDAQYRADDTLGEAHAETLQARTLARLATYAEGYDVPVLVTRSKTDEFTALVATVADQHLECEQTRMGPRFVGDEFETLVCPVDDGAYYQTTFAYWRQLLGARADQVGLESATPSPSTDSTAGVGTGVTADGETTTTLTANPLLDVWTAGGARGR